MLAAALRRNIGDRAFKNFQQCLLHAFAGHIARDRAVFASAGDFINLININYAALCFLNVVIRCLDQPQQDIFHILADISGFGQRRCVGDGKGDLQNACQRLRQQCFADARRPQKQHVALLKLNFGVFAVLVVGGFGQRVDALIVVVYGDGERDLRFILPDDMLVQMRFDLFRRGKLDGVRRAVRDLPGVFTGSQLLLIFIGSISCTGSSLYRVYCKYRSCADCLFNSCPHSRKYFLLAFFLILRQYFNIC